MESLKTEVEGFHEREPALIAKAEQCQADVDLIKVELPRVQVIMDSTRRGQCFRLALPDPTLHFHSGLIGRSGKGTRFITSAE